jgi:hypothetical protein
VFGVLTTYNLLRTYTQRQSVSLLGAALLLALWSADLGSPRALTDVFFGPGGGGIVPLDEKVGLEVGLEARELAPSSLNLHLTVLRKLAAEAAANGLLAHEFAAGIKEVKGAPVRKASGSAPG